MDLPTMRTRVRRDLRDEDAAAYRWSDDTLERHIQHAVAELSIALPREAVATLTASAGSRDLSLATVADLVRAEAVEYPVDAYPASLVRFQVWGGTLTIMVDSAPSGGESVRLYYGALHVLDATGSTIPPRGEEAVAVGAAAYAALEWSSYATNRVNLAGPETWRHYLEWGERRLRQFHGELGRLAARNTARVRRLYAPSRPGASQSTDWGP